MKPSTHAGYRRGAALAGLAAFAAFAALTALVLLVTFAAFAPLASAAPEPNEPIIGPGSWSDPLNDTAGLSWLDATVLKDGQVDLSQMELLGQDIQSIWALTEGPDDTYYLGTDDARLWSYDLLSGLTTDLGQPVPDECDT